MLLLITYDRHIILRLIRIVSKRPISLLLSLSIPNYKRFTTPSHFSVLLERLKLREHIVSDADWVDILFDLLGPSDRPGSSRLLERYVAIGASFARLVSGSYRN